MMCNICLDFSVHVTYSKSLEYFTIAFLSLRSQRERPKLVDHFKDMKVLKASYKENNTLPPPLPAPYFSSRFMASAPKFRGFIFPARTYIKFATWLFILKEAHEWWVRRLLQLNSNQTNWFDSSRFDLPSRIMRQWFGVSANAALYMR